MKPRKQVIAIKTKFKKGDRVVIKEQAFQDVLGGDKGIVVGKDTLPAHLTRSNKPEKMIKVQFDCHGKGVTHNVDPELLSKLRRR